jgi:transposase
MRPISNDLRWRIIEAIQENEESQPEIAERFAVSLSTLEKLWHRFRTTGKFEALPHAGGRHRLLEADEELIRSEVAVQPDITLAELSATVAFQKNQPPVSLSTMSEELRRLELRRKKRWFTFPSAISSASERAAWNIRRKWRQVLDGWSFWMRQAAI